MESDGFRRRFLQWVAEERGLDWVPGEESFAVAREARLERLGDLVAENVDRDAILRLVEGGAPVGLPAISSQLVSRSAGQQKTADGDAPRAKALPETNGRDPKLVEAANHGASGDEQGSKADG